MSIKIKKVLELLSKLNLYRKYKDYKDITKLLSDNNTMNIYEFMKLDADKKFIVLFSHVASTKIQQNIQMKLLYIILAAICSSTAIIGYTGM